MMTAGRREWITNDPLRNPFKFASCHWGQLKLLYGEIEFLTLAAQTHDLSQCTVVYAGAAPGHSIALLRRMFPTVMFVLVDPAPFVARSDSHVRILNTMFTDETVTSLVSELAGRTILFLSDIRLTVDDADGFEGAVFVDMLSQQRWCIGLNAAMGLLKFRLPFADQKSGPRDMQYDYQTQLRGPSKASRLTLRKGVPKDPSSVPAGSMVYLDGDIYLQLYPPSDSAETRLVVRRSASGKYKMKLYDYMTYEQTMSNFNTVTRRAEHSFPHSAMLARNIAGFDQVSFESASEAWIVSEYVRVVLGSITSAEHARAVIRVMFTIYHDMWEYTRRSIVSCKLGTPAASMNQPGMEKAVAKLLSQQGPEKVNELRVAMETMAREGILRAEAHIVLLTSLASTTDSQPQMLRRIDYLAEVTWLRSEIKEISRLLTLYSSVLSGRSRRR